VSTNQRTNAARPPLSTNPATAFHEFGTLSTQYAQARAQDDLDTVAVVCGEAIGLLKDCPAAASIVQSMATQAEGLLRNGGRPNFTSRD